MTKEHFTDEEKAAKKVMKEGFAKDYGFVSYKVRAFARHPGVPVWKIHAGHLAAFVGSNNQAAFESEPFESRTPGALAATSYLGRLMGETAIHGFS